MERFNDVLLVDSDLELVSVLLVSTDFDEELLVTL